METTPSMYAYSGKLDLVLTFLLLFILVCLLGPWRWEPEILTLLRFSAVILLGLSVVDAWKATRSPWQALLAFPIKYILAACLVLCGAITVGGIMATLGAKTSKDRITNAVVSAASAFGFLFFLHWIKKLTRPSSANTSCTNELVS